MKDRVLDLADKLLNLVEELIKVERREFGWAGKEETLVKQGIERLTEKANLNELLSELRNWGDGLMAISHEVIRHPTYFTTSQVEYLSSAKERIPRLIDELFELIKEVKL